MYKPNLSATFLIAFNLTLTKKPEIPNELIDIIAKVIRQYVIEDELGDEDSAELIKFADDLFIILNEVPKRFGGDLRKYNKWQESLSRVLVKHSKKFQSDYQEILHMREDVFFVRPWSLAILVDLGNQYKSSSMTSSYLVRYGENLISEMYLLAKQQNPK
ncbi:MAG: hypothetical protein HAW67_02565 [Endozoicomonadaceae bacterium]|nr:hypothetical protein [Endozoicomonadaceae bacterium]